jgi:hypothetical protein
MVTSLVTVTVQAVPTTITLQLQPTASVAVTTLGTQQFERRRERPVR